MAELPRPQIKTIETKSIFPRKDSLEEVEEHLKSQLPISTPNELNAALALYHNTMLHVQSQENTHASSKP